MIIKLTSMHQPYAVYTCKLCNSNATFPRYNSPRTLFKSRRGRCGEFANLFGAYCRALGFDTRYISDFTDHVWGKCVVSEG